MWAVFLSLAYLLLCLVLAYRYVHHSRITPVKPPGLSSLWIAGPSVEIPIWCTSGLEQSKPRSGAVFLFVHGYGGNREGWAPLMLDLQSRGYECVAPDLPGHGLSKDDKVGFGPKEADTVLAVAHWVRGQYAEKKPKIILVGVSMGGAACWLATEKEPQTFAAVVTEGAFARLDEASNRWFDMLFPAGRVVFAPVRWFSEWMAGVSTASVNPVEAAKKWRGRPALVIHCERDPLINRSHAERLRDACGGDFWVVPGASHAQGSGVATEEYVARLVKLAGTLQP